MPGQGYRAGGDPFADQHGANPAGDDDDDLIHAPALGQPNPTTLDDDDDADQVHRPDTNARRAATPANNNGGCQGWLVIVGVLLVCTLVLGLLGVGGYFAIDYLGKQTPAPIAKATPTTTALPTPSKSQVLYPDKLLPGSVFTVTDLCGKTFTTTVPSLIGGKSSRRTLGSGDCAVIVEFQPSQ